MNKTLIKNSREQFDHWLDGGDLYVDKGNSGTWTKLTESTWSSSFDRLDIVQDDKFFKYRVAVCEGESIEVQNVDGNWVPKRTTFKPTRRYRIKPIIKKDDWVRHTNNKLYKVDYYDVEAKLYHLKENSDTVLSQHLTLWEPRVGDYCWAWRNNPQLINTLPTLIKISVVTFDNKVYSIEHDAVWDHVVPFRGKLPTRKGM